MQRIDAQFLTPCSYILRSQHSSVGRGLITICLHLHPTRDSADCFAATGITQNVSLSPHSSVVYTRHEPEIGDI